MASSSLLNSNSRNILIVKSYIRSIFQQNIPSKITDLCTLFAFELTTKLLFSPQFKSSKGLELSTDNNTVITLRYPRLSWILCDIKPIYSGIHCFRLHIYNPMQEYLKLGVSSKKMFNDNELNAKGVWGIARNHRKNTDYYKPATHIHRNNINLAHFMQKHCMVDILLNADKGTLKLCVVGMLSNLHQVHFWNMPISEFCPGWVPHFIFGTKSKDTKLTINKIDHKWYGKDISKPLNIFEKYYKKRLKFIKITNIKSKHGWTFHFVGIRKPKHKSKMYAKKLFKNIKTPSMIAMHTDITGNDSIYALKKCIKKRYLIPKGYDILIIYADTIISYNNKLKLSDFGIKNNSLLLLAICLDKINKNQTNNTGYHKIEIKKTKGFDVIMQESNVSVYKMPICGHKMNKLSLYEYAIHTFKDSNNLCIKCPHKFKTKHSYVGWSCNYCTYINVNSATRCEMCRNNKVEAPKKTKCDIKWNYSLLKQILMADCKKKQKILQKTQKLELLLSRNKVQKECNVQKCPTCNTLYFKHNKNIKWSEIKTIESIEQNFKTQCILCCNKKAMAQKQDEIQSILWKVGDSCEIYTKLQSKRTWVKGKIIRKYSIDKWEWIVVKYHNNLIKELETKADKNLIRKIGSNNSSKKIDYSNYKHSFCFGCGDSYTFGHICDSSFKKDIINILLNAKMKNIGSVSNIPNMRCCPNCAQLIIHTDACKHMKCRSCQTDFCFVCLKLKVNNKWQCGSHSDVCSVAPKQNEKSLPNTIVINKKTFQLY